MEVSELRAKWDDLKVNTTSPYREVAGIELLVQFVESVAPKRAPAEAPNPNDSPVGDDSKPPVSNAGNAPQQITETGSQTGDAAAATGANVAADDVQKEAPAKQADQLQ